MTRVTGVRLEIAPCCGTTYSTPRYGSINLMASSYWTDGYKEGSLMPGGHGLRKCRCGNFFLLSELLEVSELQTADAPMPAHVGPEELPKAIALARTSEIERAARMNYWQELNHPYRAQYRAHREAEEAETRVKWEDANPDQRTWWQRFRKLDRIPAYQPSANRSITHPNFEPTIEQRENMQRLLDVLKSDSNHDRHKFDIAELHRELGQFGEAEDAMRSLASDDRFSVKLVAQLIESKQSAPVRYRL